MNETRLLSEILAICEFEPSLKNIYVEGNFDYQFITWFLDSQKKTDINIYTIDLVKFDEVREATRELIKRSNRNKLLVLVDYFEKNLQDKCKCLCIIDLDFDSYLTTINNKFLKYTDYNSIEIYLITPTIINKFTKLVLRGFNYNYKQIIVLFIDILKILYLIRLSNEYLKWGMKWIDIKRYLTISSEKLEFSDTRFINALLNKNNRVSEKEKFQETIVNLKKQLQTAFRFCIRGHDFTYLFYLFTNKLKKRCNFGNLETFESSLLGCVESENFKDENLFKFLSNY